MRNRKAVVRRVLGAWVALTTIVATASCDPGGATRPAAPEPPATAATSHHASSQHASGGHPSATPSAPLRQGERFVTLAMPGPYAPDAPRGGTDVYRCFLVDPGLGGPAFLTGSHFLPGNADLVHHAIFFRVAPADVATAERADGDAPGEGWTCFGDAGIGGDAAWVAHWAPGTGETLMAPGTGHLLPAGSRLVMQVHYNLLGTPSGPRAQDRSGIRLRLTDRGDLRPLRTETLPAPVELACPPGDSGPLCDREAAVRDVAHRFGEPARSVVDLLNRACNRGRAPVAAPRQRCDRPVPLAGTVYAVAGHMHLLGRSITVQLNPGTTRARTLLDVPAYDFDEQAVRPLAAPVAVRPGDVLRVTCEHDATLRRRLPALRSAPPRYVVWGEGTTDEMCLGLVVWSPAG